MTDAGWLSLLPPIMAIVLAIATKQVLLSLFIGVWCGWMILNSGNPILGFIDAVNSSVQIFADPGNTKVILFCALVGALIALTQRSGGVEGFVKWITKKGIATNAQSAQLLAWFIGILVFVESSISPLIVGAICRPMFDKHKVSREKLAYLCDSTAAPVCMLIPFNGWGAYIIGILAAQKIDQPFYHLLRATPFNFYCLFAILIPLILIIWKKDFGAMARAEKRTRKGELFNEGSKPLISTDVTEIKPAPGIKLKPANLFVPILTLIVMMPTTLYLTGHGDIMQGSGSTAVFWSVLTAIIVAAGMYLAQRLMSIEEIFDLSFKGIAGLLPLAILVLLAFCLGEVCKSLGTGTYAAGLAQQAVIPQLVPAVLFAISGFIAFSTGTSWGTFAIMLPIGLPMVSLLGLDMHLIIAAVLSGGVFGDHCSPISDTTIVSAMASASDLIDHVKTQLPYGLAGATGAFFLFVLFGFIV